MTLLFIPAPGIWELALSSHSTSRAKVPSCQLVSGTAEGSVLGILVLLKATLALRSRFKLLSFLRLSRRLCRLRIRISLACLSLVSAVRLCLLYDSVWNDNAHRTFLPRNPPFLLNFKLPFSLCLRHCSQFLCGTRPKWKSRIPMRNTQSLKEFFLPEISEYVFSSLKSVNLVDSKSN